MRIIVPYTALSWLTVEALEAAHPDTWEACYVGSDDEAYFRLLSKLWHEQEDFAIVEQDIVVNPETLTSFGKCSAQICVAPYPYLRSDTYAGLGCIRFRGGAMKAFPDLMECVARRCNPLHAQRHWCTLDAWIQRELHAHRLGRWCRHAPVGHLHRNPTHGCVPAQYLS